MVPLPPQAITARLLQISGDAYFGPKHLPVPFSLYQPKRLQKKYCPSPLSDDRVGLWHCHFAVLPAEILILATLVPNTHDFRSSWAMDSKNSALWLLCLKPLSEGKHSLWGPTQGSQEVAKERPPPHSKQSPFRSFSVPKAPDRPRPRYLLFEWAALWGLCLGAWFLPTQPNPALLCPATLRSWEPAFSPRPHSTGH